jgi:hypothetical protein
METTRMLRPGHTSLLVCLLFAVLLLPLSAVPAGAQENLVVVRGMVVDTDEQAIVGYRVVFRIADTAEVYLSTPTENDGEYAVSLPPGFSYVAVAILSPGGARVALDGQKPFQVRVGTRRNLMVDLSSLQVEVRNPVPFAGAGRLFLSFVEDTAMVENWRIEAQLNFAGLDAGDLSRTSIIGAVQFDAMPRIEFGGRIGYAGLDGSGGVPSGNGITDTDLWAKFYIGPRWMKHSEFGFGALVTLPTGTEDNLQSFDAMRSKLFFAMRRDFSRMTLSAHAGVRFNESGSLYGIPLEGSTAGSLGAAVIAPLGSKLAMVGEFVYEGERFEGFDADTRLLAGVNWKPGDYGVLRFALALGLTDGAPDSQVLASWAFDF